MKLDFAFLAEAAVVNPQGIFNVLNGGLTQALSRAFPSILPPMSLIARLHFDRDECDKSHHAIVTVFDPNRVCLFQSELDVNAPIHQYHPATGNTFLAKFGFSSIETRMPGRSVCALAVDGLELGEVPFDIILGVPS